MAETPVIDGSRRTPRQGCRGFADARPASIFRSICQRGGYRLPVGFGRDEVVDWNDMDGAVMRGNFTGCAILATASPEDRASFRAETGLDCGT